MAERERQTEIERQTETDRGTDRQTDRERQIERRERQKQRLLKQQRSNASLVEQTLAEHLWNPISKRLEDHCKNIFV